MKTKLLLPLFALCLFSGLLFAQPGSFNVGVDFTPNYSFYSGESNNYNAYVDYNYISYGSSSVKKPSINFGVVLSYQLTNKWSFESGLKYVNRGHKIKGNDYRFGYGFDPILYPSGGGEGENTILSVENYNYLSVPLNVRLALGNDINKGWYIRFGVAADFYLSSSSTYDVLDSKREKRSVSTSNERDVRKTHLNLNYGVGYSFIIANEYQLSVEPAFDYMFYRLHHKGGDFTYNSAGIKLRFLVL